MKRIPTLWKTRIEYAVFVLPILLPFLVFFIVPFFMGLYYSFFSWNGVSSTMEYLGLENYRYLFTEDRSYATTIAFTLKFVVLNVLLTNIAALGMALLLDTGIRRVAILRGAFFLPNVISTIVVGFLWNFLFGSVSSALYDMTGIGLFKTSWLGDPSISVISLVLVAVWQGMGYIMVIYLAGLQTIDPAYLEASRIDGASATQRFRHVTLPMLMPAITVNLFMTISQSFRLFDLNLTLTGGGPGKSTMGMALDIYKEAFQNNHIGYGAAKAVILFLVVLVITILQIRFTKRREVQA